jgi:hypothetical protein
VPRVCRLIETSAIPIPAVRRATLCESVRSVATEDELRALFMDAVVGSAFVPDERKDALALRVLDGQVRIALSALSAQHVYLALSALSAQHVYLALSALSAQHVYLALSALSAQHIYLALSALSAQHVYLALSSCAACTRSNDTSGTQNHGVKLTDPCIDAHKAGSSYEPNRRLLGCPLLWEGP